MHCRLSVLLTIWASMPVFASPVQINSSHNYIGEQVTVKLELESKKKIPIEITIKQLKTKDEKSNKTYKIQYPAIFHSSLEVKKLNDCSKEFSHKIGNHLLNVVTKQLNIETNRVVKYECPAYHVEVTGQKRDFYGKYMPIYSLSSAFTSESVILEKNGIDIYTYEKLYSVIGNSKRQGYCASNISPDMKISTGSSYEEDATLIKIQPSFIVELSENSCLELKNNKFVFKEYFYSTPGDRYDSTEVLEVAEKNVRDEVEKLLPFFQVQES
ncbi:hypothetical protein [Spartinivicinus ruber]|uniref:hypothetical protein n=1 Tax=Spartinivicinus ruber TaxID=2683272 RepID=UPI0013D3BD54|nr:hypothetical protein [Spartinivicinus ruber]